jgi:hypothetical protein
MEIGERKRAAVKAQLISLMHAGRHTTTRIVELTGAPRCDAIQLNQISRVCEHAPKPPSSSAPGS